LGFRGVLKEAPKLPVKKFFIQRRCYCHTSAFRPLNLRSEEPGIKVA